MTPGPVSDSSPGPPDINPLDQPVRLRFLVAAGALGMRALGAVDLDGRCVEAGRWSTTEGKPQGRTLTITARDILQALGLDQLETLSCAFCGTQYSGERPLSREILVEHVRTCEEHPLVQELHDAHAALGRMTVEHEKNLCALMEEIENRNKARRALALHVNMVRCGESESDQSHAMLMEGLGNPVVPLPLAKPKDEGSGS